MKNSSFFLYYLLAMKQSTGQDIFCFLESLITFLSLFLPLFLSLFLSLFVSLLGTVTFLFH